MRASDRATDPIVQWLRREAPALAPAWLKSQRWFGGKARTIDRVDVDEVVSLPGAAGPATLVVLRVAYGDAGSVRIERYASLLRVADGMLGAGLGSLGDGRAVADAATDGPTLLALLSGLARETHVDSTRGGRIVYADATDRAKRLLSVAADDLPRVTPIGAEQSNTSSRVGSTHVFKLFRRLESGEHPELEMGRFLSQAGFTATPPLEGSLVYRDATGDSALGVLQGWVDNRGDGWKYVVGLLERAAREGESPSGLARDLAGLGGITADFHSAVASKSASAAFAPEPVSTDDGRVWRAAIAAQAERTFTLVERHRQSWDEPAASLAALALQAQSTVTRRLAAIEPGVPDPFVKVRIHGDFHLGQTLKTRDGFMIIDFEGEPAKPLAERRSKQCALKDVAGMLRSLDYAVASVGDRRSARPENGWSADRLRAAFLDGYRSRALLKGADFLPSTEEHHEMWLSLFELEKALYEIEYEVNNRPAWVHIPLGALCRLAA